MSRDDVIVALAAVGAVAFIVWALDMHPWTGVLALLLVASVYGVAWLRRRGPR